MTNQDDRTAEIAEAWALLQESMDVLDTSLGEKLAGEMTFEIRDQIRGETAETFRLARRLRELINPRTADDIRRHAIELDACNRALKLAANAHGLGLSAPSPLPWEPGYRSETHGVSADAD